jgi:hypothetical protein
MGSSQGAALVLLRDEQLRWMAVVTRSRPDSQLGFPVPVTTVLAPKQIGGFLRAFAHYFYGDGECALKAFKALETSRAEGRESGDLSFWVGSTLAQLGRSDDAISRFRQIAGSTGGREEINGTRNLALAILLLPGAPLDVAVSKEVLSLLEQAAAIFKQKDERNWAATQIGLGRYFLLTAGPTPGEKLEAAERYFDQAESMLVLPRDEAEWANLQALMGMTQLQLGLASPGLASKDATHHFGRAMDHFQAARAAWVRIGDEAGAEAMLHQVRYVSELRSLRH